MLVDRDIPNNKMVIVEQKLKIAPNTKKADVEDREENKKKIK